MPRKKKEEVVEEPKKTKKTTKSEKAIEPKNVAEVKEPTLEEEIEKDALDVEKEDKDPTLVEDAPKRSKGVDKKDLASRGAKSLARTFVNKRDTVRLNEGRPERIMSETKRAAAELLNSRTQDQPMTVKITGIEPVRNPEGGYIMMPVALYHGWKIIIPRHEFITEDMISSSNDLEEDTVRRINGSVGSEVDIIPTKFIPDNKLVVASRLKAMEKRKEEMWNAKNITRKGEDYLLKEGTRAEARVVFVLKGGVTVELFGVESFVKMSDVAYTRVENCKSQFKAGDVTRIKITEVERYPDGKIKFSCNIKEANPDPRVDAYKQHVIGGMYNGTVTMIETDVEMGASAAYVLLDSKIEVKCRYPKKILPEIGDRVSVAIRRKDPDTLRFWGDIVHVDIQRGEFERKPIYTVL